MATVIEKSINRFLKHALFIVDNHIRRLQLHQVLEAVVPIDDATI